MKVPLLGKYVGVGFCAWLGGLASSRWWSESMHVYSQPGGRDGGVLSGTASSMRTWTMVSAAGKITDLSVPPEPPKSASRTAQILRFGFPHVDNILARDGYVVSYDRKNRVAFWVFEHLTRELVKDKGLVDRSVCEFQPDEDVHHYFRSENEDYFRSGFDRGHLAAAGNYRTSQKECNQTFLLSNIAPQVGVGFNRHSWNQLEKYVRGLTKEYKNVYVCTGTLFLPREEADGKKYVTYQVLGKNNVAVPTHFYKIMVMEAKNGDLEMDAFIMPNRAISDSISVESFRVPPETVEKKAGLLFFDRLPRNKLKRINGRKLSSTT